MRGRLGAVRRSSSSVKKVLAGSSRERQSANLDDFVEFRQFIIKAFGHRDINVNQVIPKFTVRLVLE
jgi:hypothetical protein